MILHARDQLVEIHRPKAELLAARGDGGRNLVRFGGAQDEDHPLGRLFERLQQRVEGFVGDLVGFVDDEDFVAVARRAVADVLAQLAHFVDAAVGGRVDFDHVRRIAGRDFEAAGADAAGLSGGPFDAIQAARQNARDGGFAGAALARKDVAVRDAAAANGVLERGPDVLLADQLGKRLRPVFPGDDLVHGNACKACYARPRVIRGTRAKPLPLLPSGPGGVCSRPLHGARSLTSTHPNTGCFFYLHPANLVCLLQKTC